MAREVESNPFRFGALALDEAFADREAELAELEADALNGQDVVLFAPRRYGKSSLIWRVAQRLISERALVAQVNLMTTPTPARLAERLAKTIHEDIASPLFRARERLRVFQGLRVAPTITVDPGDGSLSFGFAGGSAGDGDITATIERLLELPGQLAGERQRRVVLVLDEFQEVVEIDPGLPRLMRSVFQQQPEVAHIYLGSRRHMMERIFNDEHAPFWRSAKQRELGVIDPALFGPFISARFDSTGKTIDAAAIELIGRTTHGHPYATQELCYFVWQRPDPRASATDDTVRGAIGDVLRSENAHFSLVWDNASAHQRVILEALAAEPGHPLRAEYRRRHRLPTTSSVQRALQGLERAELIGRANGRAWIAEPFLAEWLQRAER